MKHDKILMPLAEKAWLVDSYAASNGLMLCRITNKKATLAHLLDMSYDAAQRTKEHAEELMRMIDKAREAI